MNIKFCSSLRDIGVVIGTGTWLCVRENYDFIDRLRSLFSELAKIPEGFPSCSKSHRGPTFLPLYTETSRDNNRELKRINALSVFVDDVEQRTDNKEAPRKSNKFSDCKSWCKSIWSSTKRKVVRSGPIFLRKGEKVVFNFQHYVRPERIIDEYTRVYIYNKPRLVRIEKKESPKSTSSLHDFPIPSNVNLRRCKSRCERTRTNAAANVTDGRISGWRLKKSIECAARKTRRIPKRIPATHNFIYEFNPFGKSTSNGNNAATKRSRNVANIGQGDSSLRSSNGQQSSNNVQTQSTSPLPKLNSHGEIAFDVNFDKRLAVANFGKSSNLQNIKKHEMNVERLVRNRNEKRRRNLTSEIDREVERVKTDWQALRTSGGWTQSKNFANPRTRKLYDTLEKMTREIDKMQRSYMDPKSNQFLQRGAMKALDPPEITFEEKAGKMRDILFPTGNKKLFDETLTSSSNDIPSRNVRPETKSLLSNSRPLAGVKNPTRSACNLSSSFDKPNANIKNVHTKKISSDIEQYIDKYISEAENNFLNRKEPGMKEADVVAPDDVADMLKKLNMDSFDMYDVASDGNEDPPVQSGVKLESMDRQDSAKDLEEYLARLDLRETGIGIGSSSNTDDHSTTALNNVVNYDSSIQTSTKGIYGDNAFLEMGSQALNNSFPQSILSRVMQSEYLKKDASLKPM